jgi:hypothetical protein
MQERIDELEKLLNEEKNKASTDNDGARSIDEMSSELFVTLRDL